MLFKRLNRNDAERVFSVFKANAAGIAADDVVSLETNSASIDGVNIIQPVAAQLGLVVGVADAAIANGAYGLVQIYGYRSTSRVVQTTSSIPAGAGLVAVAAADYLDSVTASAFGHYFHILESVPANTLLTVSRKIFIRCM